uniref:DUF3456 domain-containing protein n=1 Tax=Ditylenchus dipsaci TaxID=166011 RepID=A0A915CR31_9BILA
MGGSNDLLDESRYMPTKCESCHIFANEMEKAVSWLPKKMATDEAEGWLIDQMEHICDHMLTYRLHKEKEGLARFSREISKTANTLKDLAERGVEITMDVPADLLDQPSLESGKIKDHCEWIIEEFEADIEQWFQKHREHPLQKYLCQGRLVEVDPTCLKPRDEL